MKSHKSSLYHITIPALFTTLALAIYYAESLIPPLVPLPGIKLGLANIITLVILKKASFSDALRVLLMRILIASFLFGQAVSLLYSLSGGLLSLLTMYLINKLLRGYFTGIIGIFGALTHNLGQLAVAVLLTSSLAPISYLPFFVISSILTGLFTGLCSHYALRYLPAHFFP